jgi:hypothetical protein
VRGQGCRARGQADPDQVDLIMKMRQAARAACRPVKPSLGKEHERRHDMSENSLSINAGAAAFHPASHYESPRAVLADSKLSAAEKRLILSSWASDMYAVEGQPGLREIPGIAHRLRLSDILGALRQLDRDDQPPRPSGGAAMRVMPQVNIAAYGLPAGPAGAGRSQGSRARPLRPSTRSNFSREADIRRYRRLLATPLADHERHFVERRLAEELRQLDASR